MSDIVHPQPDSDDPPTRPVRAWFAARGSRPVLAIASALIVVQLTVRGALAYRGSFYLDDFAFTGRAAEYPIWSGEYLLHSYNSHVMPGSFAWVWVLTRIWPLSYAPVATVDIALQGLLAVLVLGLLRDLFGTRPAILVPLAAFLFTPITLAATLWWAAALNQLPQQIALVVALRCQVRYLRTGRTRTGVYGALAVLVGLLFSEKTLLAVPLVAVITVVYFHGGPLPARLRDAVVAHRAVWLTYLVVAVPYAVYYQFSVPSPVREGVSGASVLDLVANSFGHALLPGLLGGPWHWRPIGWAGALADPGSAASVASVLAVSVIIAASVFWWRRAIFGWAIIAAYAVLNLALLTISRATVIGPVIGDEFRYITDVAVVAVLGGALALLPIRGGTWARADVQRREVRAGRPRLSVAGTRASSPPRRLLGMPIILVLVAVLVTSALVSTLRYDRYWHDNPARRYLAAVKQGLGATAHPVLVNRVLPQDVVWGLLYPYNELPRALRPLHTPIDYLGTGTSSDHLAMVDDQGHLRKVAIQGLTSDPGPVSGCGWLLEDRSIGVPLSRETAPGTWVVRIGYIANADTATTVIAGRTRVRTQLHKGLNAIYLQVEGRVATVVFGALPSGVSMCTSDIAVGDPVPIPGTGP